MMAWKEHKHIDFNFYDLQFEQAINSKDEYYIKNVCRNKINRAGKFILLIGEDTRFKDQFVRWEAEVAIERGCTIIGANLNKSRFFDQTLTPSVIWNVGAVFVPFSSRIIAHALEGFKPGEKANYVYPDWKYTAMGYVLEGSTARIPKPPNPFAG